MQNINDIWLSLQDWTAVYGLEIIKAVIILTAGIWLINKICRISTIFLRQTNLEISLISFFNSSLKFFLNTILILLLMSILGVNVTSVITAISAFIVTFGLVTKDILSNFASGFVIILNKPIRVGDYIEFENVKGTVAKIEMMFTTLRTPDDNSVIIPNFRLSSNNIIRKSPFDICKTSYNFTVSNTNSKQDIVKLLTFLLASDERVLQLPPPEIEYKKLDNQSSKLNIELFCEKRYFKDLESELLNKIIEHLTKYGFEVINSNIENDTQ